MLDHVKLFVSDFPRSREFYEAALEPLGFRTMIFRPPAEAGMGADFPCLWIQQGEPVTVAHIALRADQRATVDAFHAAGLRAGGTDNGAPGLRPHYHPSYYGAFVLDPDGNNLEVVCHRPEGGS
jgi:catechol 2,3-dioxygenase-like lactoylglutathione lyase family enzyme